MKSIASQHRDPRLGRLRSVLVVLAVAGLVSGCIAPAASTSPVATAMPSPFTSPSTHGSASPTPPTPTPLPSVGTAPAGGWSGIHWIAAGPVFPQTPVPSSASGDMEVDVFGWSGGYVGFRTAYDYPLGDNPQATVALVSTSSADGLHWTAGRPMDIQGLPHPSEGVAVSQVLEGPSGLLAVGEAFPPLVCAGPPKVDALWTSADGLIWTRVQPPADFASASVYTVDAGSTGYIASGTLKDGVTQAVWLSGDGRSWRQVPLAEATFGKFVVDGATDFAAGYVVFGTVVGNEGCGGGADLTTPSLWWSSDGKSWTRGTLTGAAPASDAWMAVSRISDRALVAIATEWNQGSQTNSQLVWVTTDGRTWSLVKSPSSLLSAGILTNGERGLVVVGPTDTAPATIANVGDDLTVTALSQTGNGPAVLESSVGGKSFSAALGPTGVVVLRGDGLDLWLGVPTAP